MAGIVKNIRALARNSCYLRIYTVRPLIVTINKFHSAQQDPVKQHSLLLSTQVNI